MAQPKTILRKKKPPLKTFINNRRQPNEVNEELQKWDEDENQGESRLAQEFNEDDEINDNNDEGYF